MKVLNINSEHFASIGIQNILQKHFKDTEFNSSCDYDEILKLSEDQSFDIILLDISITGINTHKLMKTLTQQQKTAEILIFSQTEYKPYAVKYVSLGASGFLDKSSSEKEFIQAIKLITTGFLYLSRDMLMSVYNDNISAEANNTPFSELSKRELEVFKLLIKGKRVKDISEIMQIHQSTTSTLKKRIMLKFNVDNLMKLKTMAMEYGY